MTGTTATTSTRGAMLEGRVALVTGGRGGAGRAVCERFVAEGAHVFAADLTYETYDFFLESADPNEAELESIRYLDEVLQVEDINLVESVQRGMRTPAFAQGRIVNDPSGSGLSEHALHHFHGLVLDAYASLETKGTS